MCGRRGICAGGEGWSCAGRGGGGGVLCGRRGGSFVRGRGGGGVREGGV